MILLQRSTRWILAVLCVVGGVVGTTIVVSGKDAAGGLESRYQILSRGFRVGDLKTTMHPLVRDGRHLIRFESITNISADFLFFSRQSTSREEALISERGTEEYHRSSNDKGQLRKVTARFTDHQAVIDIRDEKGHTSVTVPRNKYDYTTMDCPEIVILAREGDHGEVRLLDLENARVVTRKYEWIRSELVKVGGRSIRCRVIDFEDPENRCRRWISRDERGIIIARQEGKGKSGSYQLKMTGLIEDQAAL